MNEQPKRTLDNGGFPIPDFNWKVFNQVKSYRPEQKPTDRPSLSIPVVGLVVSEEREKKRAG